MSGVACDSDFGWEGDGRGFRRERLSRHDQSVSMIDFDPWCHGNPRFAKLTRNHRTSTTFVKKKAALTLLRLYRKHPTVLNVSDWAERIVTMMDDPDPGVALTVTSLVTALAQSDLEGYSGCYQKAVDRLDRVGSCCSRSTNCTNRDSRSSLMVTIRSNIYITK